MSLAIIEVVIAARLNRHLRKPEPIHDESRRLYLARDTACDRRVCERVDAVVLGGPVPYVLSGKSGDERSVRGVRGAAGLRNRDVGTGAAVPQG